MSTELMAKLFQLNQLKKLNETLTQRQQSMEELTKSLKDFDLRRDSVVDDIKVCRSDVNIIESMQTSNELKCFWPKCQYKTSYESLLKRHQLIHTNEKSFECNECQKLFQHLSHLKVHQLVHSNERQFVCDWSECGKRFKTNTILNQHKLGVHLKEKRFKCDYNDCGKRFINRCHLIEHKYIHSGEKPFTCVHKNCGQRFRFKSYLKKHNKTKHLK